MTDEPKKLRYMTNAEIGALVRAAPEDLEVWAGYRRRWIPACGLSDSLEPNRAYRIKPDPKVRTQFLVNLNGESGSWWSDDDGNRKWTQPCWRVTVTWIDGVPSFGPPEWVE